MIEQLARERLYDSDIQQAIVYLYGLDWDVWMSAGWAKDWHYHQWLMFSWTTE